MTIVSLSAAISLAGFARAESFVDINFDTGVVGSQVPTAPFGASPVTHVTALGGYVGTPSPSVYTTLPNAAAGTINVANVDTMSKAALMSTAATNSAVGSLWMDTSLNFMAEQLRISFDVNVQSQAAGGYAQTNVDADTAAPVDLLLGLRLYSSSEAKWGPTFQLVADDANTGRFGFRNLASTSVKNFGSYEVGDTNHIDIDVNYTTGLLSAFVNGAPALSGYQFWPTGATNVSISEMFIYLNGSSGVSNQVALDNLQVAVVPLPQAALGGGVMLMALALKRPRRSEA